MYTHHLSNNFNTMEYNILLKIMQENIMIHNNIILISLFFAIYYHVTKYIYLLIESDLTLHNIIQFIFL